MHFELGHAVHDISQAVAEACVVKTFGKRKNQREDTKLLTSSNTSAQAIRDIQFLVHVAFLQRPRKERQTQGRQDAKIRIKIFASLRLCVQKMVRQTWRSWRHEGRDLKALVKLRHAVSLLHFQ